MAFRRWDVQEFLEELPAGAFAFWQAVWSLDPWGGARGDLQAAYVGAAAIAPHTRSHRPPRAGDFLPALRSPPGAPTQSLATQKAIFAAAKEGFARAREARKQQATER